MKQTDSESGKKFLTKKRIIVLSVLLAIIGLCVWDIGIDPPAFWRTERVQDKRAILAYVKEKYPDAVQIGRGEFPLPKPVAPHQASIMDFSLDGIDFHIAAEYGKVVEDVYSKRRAEAQFNAIIQDKFLKPRGLEAETAYNFSGDYDIYPYVEGLGVILYIRNQGRTPREIGWLYDFYSFWKEEGAFLSSYSVLIEIFYDNNDSYIRYSYKDEYPTEEAFYAAFNKI